MIAKGFLVAALLLATTNTSGCGGSTTATIATNTDQTSADNFMSPHHDEFPKASAA